MTEDRFWGAVALVALALGSVGCVATQTPSDGADLIDESTPTLPFVVHVGGDVDGSFSSSSLPVRIRTLTDPVLGDQRFLLVESVEPVVLDSGTTVHPGMNLIGFKGDGSYGIGSTEQPTATAPTTQANSLSNGWMELHDGETVRLFRIGECSTQIRNGGRAGSLTCPRLRDDEGKTIALTLGWGEQR